MDPNPVLVLIRCCFVLSSRICTLSSFSRAMPESQIRMSGSPWWQNIFAKKEFATSTAVSVPFQATKWTVLDSLSTEVLIESNPLAVCGGLTIQSVAIELHLHFGTSDDIGSVSFLFSDNTLTSLTFHITSDVLLIVFQLSLPMKCI